MRKSYRVLVVAALGAVLIGCGGAGETTRKVVKNLNPVNWFGDDDAIENEGVKETKDRQALKRGGSPARKSFPEASCGLGWCQEVLPLFAERASASAVHVGMFDSRSAGDA